MTLTEFLLTRIAEDERLVAEYPGLTPGFPPKWELGLYYEDGIAMTLTVSAARVRAECEAKRRIVKAYPEEVDMIPVSDGLGPVEYEVPGLRYVPDALRLLALPYAGHPDYDKDWRL